VRDRTVPYDRSSLSPTVVHIGPGVFHRGHQAVYCDDVLRSGEPGGGIWGISLRSPRVADALAFSNFVYDVAERSNDDSDPSGVRTRLRTVGSLLGVDVLARAGPRVFDRLVDPAVTVVTVTVTEHGYCATTPGGSLDTTRSEMVHDLAQPSHPISLPGVLAEAIRRRRAAAAPALAIASCDNIPDNGAALRRVVTEFAELVDPSLATWIVGNISFPSSMVDRMVPTPSAADAGEPVITEPFSQWVLQDDFPSGRPRWELAGVELVGDVSRFEQAKLRILNAAHSALAYWGLLLGHETIADAVADATVERAVRELIDDDAIPTLAPPEGWDLAAYREEVLARFANRSLGYTTAKVASDGSQKLAVRIMPTIVEWLHRGRIPTRSVQVIAAWALCISGPAGERHEISDAALGDRCDGRIRDLIDVIIDRAIVGVPAGMVVDLRNAIDHEVGRFERSCTGDFLEALASPTVAERAG